MEQDEHQHKTKEEVWMRWYGWSESELKELEQESNVIEIEANLNEKGNVLPLSAMKI